MDILSAAKVQFIFITNGILVDADVIRRLLKYEFNWVQVSIDGFNPETHDRIRGKKGSWKRAVIAAKQLSDTGLPTVVAYTALKSNLSEIGDMIDFCGTMGVKRIVIGEMIPVGRAAKSLQNEILSKKDVERIIEVTMEKRKVWNDIFEIAIPLPFEIQVKLKVLQPNSVMLIRPDGNVRIDCIMPFSVGNVLEQSLDEIWENASLVHFNKDLHAYALEISDSTKISESQFGVSYVTKDFKAFC
jgi:MoaA/NifB/PqqE/SkfB family radical SAM enzyme